VTISKLEKFESHLEKKMKPSIWSLSYFSLLFCAVISAVLVLFYLYIIKPYVFLPADILTWAETNFVGDIIKLRIGAPIYTPPEDSNCNVYTPGAQLLTYIISWLFGKTTSIPAWRIIQLFFVFCGALIATACCRILNRLAFPDKQISFAKTWLVFTFLAMFVTATAPVVNSNSHTLQSDALALLISIFSFFTILLYFKSPNKKNLILMAICPALGYMVKQNQIAWLVAMFFSLLLHDPKNKKHLILFVVVAGMSVLTVIGLFYLIWGDPYIFWTFKVLGGPRKRISFSPGALNISLARSLDHIIRAWMEIAIGFVGGLLILQGSNIRKLGPVWIAWILIIISEAVVSGINWGPLYHFGPGVVIGAIWLFASLPRYWPVIKIPKNTELSQSIYHWMKPLISIAAVITFFIALRTIPTGDRSEARYWKPHSLSDVYRYISDIEHEFKDVPIDTVLLDIGNWIYLRNSVLAKDRAISLADQPPGGIYENLDIMVSRICKKTYSKILMHDLHSPFFPYDWFSWDRPSGIREALLENYVEIRTIPAVEDRNPPLLRNMQTGPVSVLVPKTN
jgi:hypothetical protein